MAALYDRRGDSGFTLTPSSRDERLAARGQREFQRNGLGGT
jgi:hypothetical protein